MPFVDRGAGLALTDIGEPDPTTLPLEFNIHLGLGTHYFLQDYVAFNFRFRGFHISNP